MFRHSHSVNMYEYPTHYLCSYVLVRHQSSVKALIYWAATALVLIPSPLFEIRYYLMPFILLRLQLRPGTFQQVRETLFYIVINVASIYLFLYRPFSWPQENGMQRFMW